LGQQVKPNPKQKRQQMIPTLSRVIAPRPYHFLIAVWSAKEAQSDQREVPGKSSPTISAKPVGVGAASQRLISTGKRSGLQTRIATMERDSLLLRKEADSGS